MYNAQAIAEALRAARIRKGLSQRALSDKAGVPQSHISKIEAANVDMRLSSLTELARVLDLELALVPRNAVPAVSAIARSSEGRAAVVNARPYEKQLANLEAAITEALHRHPQAAELSQIQSRVKDVLRLHLQAPINDPSLLKAATASIRAFRGTAKSTDEIKRTLAELTGLRNEMAHVATQTTSVEPTRPAYSLDETENG